MTISAAETITHPAERQAERAAAVAQVVQKTRAIEVAQGITRESLHEIRRVLLSLAARRDLFPLGEFPPPRRGEHKDIAFYRLSQDEDGRRALYVSVALPGKESPPHDHGNWAVLVGLKGVEINRLYERVETPAGPTVRQRDEVAVGPGVGLALLPEDIHSIHVQGSGDEPVIQLRYYERGLELQTERSAFAPGETGASNFPLNLNIAPLG
ncbi:cysteine dioxygenase [Muricoccus radiodurans]|uniref:cysteine dioxygenase family protein n=1 Tax=Muricoccus radiodurans TaxID=2231721 RepID=UPI003CEAD571